MNLNWREWSRGTWMILAGFVGLTGGVVTYEIYKPKKKLEEQDKKSDQVDQKKNEIIILYAPGLRDLQPNDALACAKALGELPKEVMYNMGTSTTSPFVRGGSLFDFAKMDLASTTGDPAEPLTTADMIRRAIDTGYYDSEGNLVKIDPKHAAAEKCLRDMADRMKEKLSSFRLPEVHVPTTLGEYVRVGGRVIPSTRIGAMFMSKAGTPAGRRKFGTSHYWDIGFARGYADCKRAASVLAKPRGQHQEAVLEEGVASVPFPGSKDWEDGYKAGWAKCEKEKPFFTLTTSAEYNAGYKAGKLFCEKWYADPTRVDKSPSHVIVYVLKDKSEDYRKGFYDGKAACEKARAKGPPKFNEEYERGRAEGHRACALDKSRWDTWMGSIINDARRGLAPANDFERGWRDGLKEAGCGYVFG